MVLGPCGVFAVDPHSTEVRGVFALDPIEFEFAATVRVDHDGVIGE